MSRKVLITGITGQDGAYLAKWLLSQGYDVYGGYRRTASGSAWRLESLGIERDVRLVPLDMLEMGNVLRVLDVVSPDEIYNLAAQSFVAVSFEQPLYTYEVNALGVGRLLECIRVLGLPARFYQASTSEMFGKVQEVPQHETTPFHPRSPYGVSKVFAHWCTVNHREAHGMHASCGILFNHESPLRGVEFVTRKIVSGLARVRSGLQHQLVLGNLDAQRDWGFAGDYVRGMWLMLQRTSPDDYVLATGETHSVREFVECAARSLGFELEWVGEGANQLGVDRLTGKTVVSTSRELYRPAEVDLLVGNAGKAQSALGWSPAVRFEELAAMMVEAEVDRMSVLGGGLGPGPGSLRA